MCANTYQIELFYSRESETGVLERPDVHQKGTDCFHQPLPKSVASLCHVLMCATSAKLGQFYRYEGLSFLGWETYSAEHMYKLFQDVYYCRPALCLIIWSILEYL